MRRLLAAVLLALLVASPVTAHSYPAGLDGSLTIVASDAATVTLHAEQTAGPSVTLKVEHFCYDAIHDAVAVHKDTFVGAANLTYPIGPRTLRGRAFTPTECWALLEYQITGNTLLIFDQATTL